jgi:hypothetical protein
MAVIKRRGAAKKLGPIGYIFLTVRFSLLTMFSLGRKFVSFKVHDSDRHFTVHEDLLCDSAGYFKKRLQKNRKPIDGECSSCHEDLDREADDVTFCRSGCGQNLHEKCIEQWKKSRAGPPTCPMCRKFWRVKPEDVIEVEDDTTARVAVQAYVNWLYTGKVIATKEGHDPDDDSDMLLLKAWRVSHVFQDDRFKNAIIAEYMSSTEFDGTGGFNLECVVYAYEGDVLAMREFVVDTYLMYSDGDTMQEYIEDYPAEFTQDLCIAALKMVKEGKTSKDLLEKHTKGEYELQDDE